MKSNFLQNWCMRYKHPFNYSPKWFISKSILINQIRLAQFFWTLKFPNHTYIDTQSVNFKIGESGNWRALTWKPNENQFCCVLIGKVGSFFLYMLWPTSLSISRDIAVVWCGYNSSVNWGQSIIGVINSIKSTEICSWLKRDVNLITMIWKLSWNWHVLQKESIIVILGLLG